MSQIERITNNTEEESINHNQKIIDFEKLIFSYLKKNSINIDIQEQSEYETLIKKLLERLGFFDNIELIIIQEWKKVRLININISQEEFAKSFIVNFHHVKLNDVVPEFVAERNKKILEAYNNILKNIEQIQALFNQAELRTRIESDFRNKPYVFSTIFQTVTPFCIISLGCDEVGRYNIVYSVDYRFQEILSDNLANKLIRNIYKFTSGEIESFVRIGSLNNDCINVFQQLKKDMNTEQYHKIITVEKP